MKNWTLAPNKYLSKPELTILLRKAEDARALGVARRQKQPVRDWAIIRIALLAGLRANEISLLRVSDCFVGYGEGGLVVKRGKGGKTRVVRIGADLKRDIRWLLGWKRENGEYAEDAFLIRSQRAERMTPGALWRRWKRYCPAHRLHDARHSYGTMLYSNTKDLRLVQTQLGHSRPATTSIYAAVTDEEAREGVRAFEDAVEKLAKDSPQNCELPKNLPHKPARTAGRIASL